MFWKMTQVLALLGGVLTAFNGLSYFYRLAKWGVAEHWHFLYVTGWGFPFLAHLETVLLALLLIAPRWMIARTRAPAQYLACKKLVNVLVVIGLLLFVIAVVVESYLARAFP
jgi:hypothetical protein